MVENGALRENEKEWLNAILSEEFYCRDEIIKQISCAKISREYTNYYLSLKFTIKSSFPSIKSTIRVPVEMRVYKKGKPPTQFLLHIVNGYLNELEIFNADSSRVNPNLTFSKHEKKIFINAPPHEETVSSKHAQGDSSIVR